MNEAENNIINNIENSPDVDYILESEKSIQKPDPKNFTDTYTEEEIKRDLTRLEEREKSFGEENKRSKALEVVIADQIYDGEWLGPDALAFLSSRYDDVFNGIDIVVEFEEEKIAFAIDASTCTDPSKIEEKIKNNLDKIKKNKCEVKYFQSQRDDYKGRLKEFIPVVVGVDKKNADSLFVTFSELKKREKEKDETMKSRRMELRRRLAETEIQDIFLQQIKIQLEMYVSLIEDETIKEKCERILSIINEVIILKEDKLYMTEDVPLDGVFDIIERVTRLTH